MSTESVFDEVDFLQSFHADPVLISKALEDCEKDILTCTSVFTNITSPVISQRPEEFFTPVIFRKPASFHTPRRFVIPQICAPQRLINLSFSQPSTPKTPALTGHHQGTPFRSTYEAAMLTTPMLIKTLDNIQQQTWKTDNMAPYPDILQLIDEDSFTRTRLDQHIDVRGETSVTDSNLMEYLLDLSQEVKHQAMSSVSETKAGGLPSKEAAHQSARKVFHRARRRTKLMTEEERQSIQRLQREKQKQKRKDKFISAQRTGCRKSKRVRSQVVRYS
ncbi:uncharacterized protein LOC123526213 isoform X2 [Mercenaria mercenaria]|uniref:uncharacterized protein LOC123526213 isoform X2 n=1 Tax=Mercenaria mercenaria TaxID=6596 RepID=UPI00234FAAEA|nr:uncharacterized protein LOC123526213 isoform X2 [Mercenaria mercenaria]